MGIEKGQVVYSKVGRDAGRCFAVVGILDENHVLIADGDLRRIEKPKKKKNKHLRFTDEVIASLYDKLTAGQKVSNAELRKALPVVRRESSDQNP